MITVLELAEFEERIADRYSNGEIRAPVHLRSGNEQALINIFRNFVSPDDYCFCTWASHHHALLKGVPSDEVEQAILDGKSITLNFPDYNFYSSAIVGGIGPIATGVAWSIKNRKSAQRVFCFIGDMALRHGTVHESICYSIGHDLPITFVVEDNGVSVCTDTQKTCGISTSELCGSYKILALNNKCRHFDIVPYVYENGFPHAGVGKFISF